MSTHLDSTLAPALFTTTLSPAREERRFQGIPGIERSPGGLLWASWYAGGPDQPGEGPGNFVVLSTSADDGATWKEALIIHPPSPQMRVFDQCLWLDPQGRLWLFWAQSYDCHDGRHGVWCAIADHPDDPATGWSTPRRICDGVMMNKPIVLSSGCWLLPVSVWRLGKRLYDLSAISGPGVVASSDQGETWNLLGRTYPENPSFDEHMVVERKDGSLWMLIRTRHGIAESVSTNQGHLWSPARPSGIPHIDARFFLRRLASGRLLLVTHHIPAGYVAQTKAGRSHLTAWLSEDDGTTWLGGLLLDEREEISYPDGTEEPDGRLRIIYDRDRPRGGEILMAVITEAEILAREVTTGILRHRIS